MKRGFFSQQAFFSLLMVFVWNTTVNRAYRGTLGFIVKAFAFGAFIAYDVVHVHAHRCLGIFCIHFQTTVTSFIGSFYAGAVRKAPFCPAFIDGVVWALGLAGPAVDALVGYFNCHFLLSFEVLIFSPQIYDLNP